jgi:choline dehydrogenase
MTGFDYIIVGAGTAGCVLAHRLSADPSVRVLLIEAGGRDDHPLIPVPGAFPQLMSRPEVAWQYATGSGEQWARGRTLGGSSSINGVLYNRGGPGDYDGLAALGNPGWGWDGVLPAFLALEDNALGRTATRGAGGPLHVSTSGAGEPLLEAVIEAGAALGWRRVRDLNETEDERLGYSMVTVRGGERVSAATAFLHPVLHRANLTVQLNTTVDRVVLENGRAVGVRGRRDGGRPVEFRAGREVLLAAGTLASPRLLELSGIGAPDVLRAAGVDVVVDSPNVGRRLREHRMFRFQFRLSAEAGYNALLTGDGRAAEELYRRERRGPLAAPSFDLLGFFKTRPELDRPDAQFQVSPCSMRELADPGRGSAFEREPGMWCVAYPLRPTSEGHIHITSADPDAAPAIEPSYLATASDRADAVAVYRGVRRLFATAPLAGWLERETVPGREACGDEDIVELSRTAGMCGFHASGTCAMGPHGDDVVDSRLRVRGVRGLRVVDAAVFPVLVSGNTAAPVMVLAWRAADLIQADAG